MGNCLFGGMGDPANDEVIRVVTSNGGIMEFNGGPVTVEFITDEFPGQGIFRSHDLFWKPLPHNEVLVAGESYYLLPLNTVKGEGYVGGQIVQVGHVRSNSVPAAPLITPYRMSFDGQGILKRSHTDVFSRQHNNNNRRNTNYKRSGFGGGGGGVWKVKLVISPGQLLDILSQEARTQELIESVRTVAKCRNVGFSSLAFSDQWSLSSSSRNASSKKDCLLEI